MFTLCTLSMAPCMKLMPTNPANWPPPLIVILRRLTTMFGVLMVTEAETIKALVHAQSIVIDVVIVNTPQLEVSRQWISPPGLVFEWAMRKEAHGAIILQRGLASLPVAETNVTCDCASAGAAYKPIIVTVRMGRMA